VLEEAFGRTSAPLGGANFSVDAGSGSSDLGSSAFAGSLGAAAGVFDGGLPPLFGLLTIAGRTSD